MYSCIRASMDVCGQLAKATAATSPFSTETFFSCRTIPAATSSIQESSSVGKLNEHSPISPRRTASASAFALSLFGNWTSKWRPLESAHLQRAGGGPAKYEVRIVMPDGPSGWESAP
jgi:hypothetical protein